MRSSKVVTVEIYESDYEYLIKNCGSDDFSFAHVLNLYKNRSKKIDKLIAQSVDNLFEAQNIDFEEL